MKTHTFKWTPIFGVGVPVDSQTFRERLQRSKHLVLRSSLYHQKAIEVWMSKMGSHNPFGHLQHKLWQEERPRVKTDSLTPDHKKSRIDSNFVRVGGMRYVVEKSRWELQFFFRPHPDRRSEHEVITLQSCRSSNLGSFGTPLWESRNKKPFGCRLRGEV
jgi:hypothetical protein